MKVKTFILTFLMMSCPFLFGQHFNPDVPTGYETEKTITAKIVLDGVTLEDASYEIATYVGDKCEGVSTIDAETNLPNGMDDVYYTSIVVHGDNNTGDIHFRLWDGTNKKEYVSSTKVPFNGDIWTIDEELGSLADLYVINFKSVAQIEGTEYDVVYPSLQEAFAAAGDVATITLLNDTELAEKITIPNGKKVTLDLNGKTVSGVCNGKEAHLFMIRNTAKLTVEDSSENEAGKITYARGTSDTGYTFDIEGELVLNSGTLELTGANWNIGYVVDVRPNSWATEYTEGTTFTMNGGKLVSADGAVRVASSSSEKHEKVSANFIMNGGEIEAVCDGIFVQQSNAEWDVLNVTINNGTIKSDLNPIRFYGPAATSYVNGEDCVDIVLNGGTMTYTGTEQREWLVDDILRIGGGVTTDDFLKDSEVTASATFAENNPAAEGYKWVENDGAYILATCHYVAQIGDKKYESLQDAIDAATEGQTVTLINDITIVTDYNNAAYGYFKVNADDKITIDLNGKKITATESSTGNFLLFSNYGELTLNDSQESAVVELTATNNRAWNAQSTIVLNRGGVLTINGGKYVHKGGTDMAITICNSANSFGPAYLHVNDGEIISENYIGVRMRMENPAANGNPGNDISYMYVNGGYIYGLSRGVWGQKCSGANEKQGELVVTGGTIENATEGRGAIEFDTDSYEAQNVVATISGEAVIKGQVIAGKDEMSISGGTFTTDVTEYCAFGYACQANGDGTYGIVETTSFEIPNLDRLIAFRNAVNAGNTFKNQTVTVTADINMETVANWTPIGTSANSFQGTFDGGNFTISNLKINDQDASFLGLFGRIDSPAVLKNIKIENVNIVGEAEIGAIVGNGYTGAIDNCHVTGEIHIEGKYKVAGISGGGYAKINNSSVIATEGSNSYVKATFLRGDREGDNVGGIVGHTGEGSRDYKNNTVKNILISGTRKVGGIAGILHQTAFFENNVVENVTIETSAETEYANSNLSTMSMGALIGQYYTAGSTNNGTVKDCVVKNVTFNNVNDVTVDVGPIVGGARGGSGAMLPPSDDITASGNAVYMTTVNGSNNFYLMKAVAKIEETNYYTLEEAIAAANNQIVTVLENVELRNTLTINVGQVVTLDLNGKTISGFSTTATSSSLITNNGNLTVQSSVEGGKITSLANNPDLNGTPAYANNTITNCGVLTLLSGTIENSTEQGYACYPIDNNSTSRDAIVNIEGGLVTGRGAIRQFANSETNKNEVNVTGGQVAGTSYAIWVQNPNDGNAGQNTKDVKAALNISAGELGKILLEASAEFEIAISGGTISEVTFWQTDETNPERNASAFITGGTFGQDPTAYVAPGYVVKQNTDGTYGVFLGVAKINETGAIYGTLQAAVNAATAGQTITLLDGITEDVTVDSRSLTIDGAEKSYTGNIAVKGSASSTEVTVKSVNFVNGTGYAITTNTIKSITVEDCTVNNYGFGFLYANKTTTNVIVKNVTVNGGSYGFHWVYGTTATLESVTMTNVKNGLYIQNYASKTINVKDCNITSIAIWERDGYSGVQTFKFVESNIVGSLSNSQYAKYQLVPGATLEAPADYTVEPSEEGYIVEYEEGKYIIKAAIAKIGDVIYPSIQEAIDAAADNDVIEVLQDINLENVELQTLAGSYNTYFKVEGKAVTIDLKGKTISGEYAITSPMLVGVFSTDNNGHLTLEDNSEDKTGAVNVTTADGCTVYSLIANYEPGCSISINGGTYTLDKAADSHIYSGSTNDETQGVTVNGGVFNLGNVGTGSNGKPWMFNCLDNNRNHVKVFGGTYNANVFNQYWRLEVQTTKEYAIKYDGDEAGTWTVVPAVAWVDNYYEGGYKYELGYATLAEAFAAAQENNYVGEDGVSTVIMLQSVELAETLEIEAGKEVVLDLKGNNIDVANDQVNFNINGKLTLEDAIGTGVFTSRNHFVNEGAEFIVKAGTVQNVATATGGFPINLNGGSVTINGGTVQAVNNANYAIGGNGGTLVINGGTVKGNWGAVNLQSGNATITDGTLEVTGTTGGHALYVAGDAQVTIEGGEFKPYVGGSVASYALFLDSENATVNVSGGMFHKEWQLGCVGVSAGTLSLTGGTFEQDVNAYCAEGFAAVDNGDGTWTVMPTQEQHLVAGWNWYSTYLDIETADLTGAIGSNGTEIKNQDGGKTYYVSQLNEWKGSLDIDLSKMYMINVNEACSLQVASGIVNAEDYTINLRTAWSWIGYPSNQEIEINTALANIPNPNEGDRIKSQYSGYAEYRWGAWRGSLKTLVPGIGYMYNNKTETAKSFKYNIPAPATTRGAVEANVTAENNYWTPNATKYPFNMTMTAVVDGLTDGNYEVAAFVNGEVRGSARPIYVEALDAYMFFLTIHGEDVEEMSFRLYDIDNDTEYDFSDRINYSNNAEVGSIAEPYVFSRGTTGIGESSMSEVNIYPNPTTIGTEINLQATCDTVEVFNALGVKLAEYQNVDSIDALETAGIYVIRITNNGNTQNCRLVVK